MKTRTTSSLAKFIMPALLGVLLGSSALTAHAQIIMEQKSKHKHGRDEFSQKIVIGARRPPPIVIEKHYYHQLPLAPLYETTPVCQPCPPPQTVVVVGPMVYLSPTVCTPLPFVPNGPCLRTGPSDINNPFYYSQPIRYGYAGPGYWCP